MPRNTKLVEIEKGLQRRLHPTGRAFVTGETSPKPGIMGKDLPPVPRIWCKSCFNFSMQASSFHYCEPRDDIGPWEKVEIGQPSKPMPELEPYRDEEGIEIYAFVPLKLVAELVLKEGGFA